MRACWTWMPTMHVLQVTSSSSANQREGSRSAQATDATPPVPPNGGTAMLSRLQGSKRKRHFFWLQIRISDESINVIDVCMRARVLRIAYNIVFTKAGLSHFAVHVYLMLKRSSHLGKTASRGGTLTPCHTLSWLRALSEDSRDSDQFSRIWRVILIAAFSHRC